MPDFILAVKKCKTLFLIPGFCLLQIFSLLPQSGEATKFGEQLVPGEFAIAASALFDLLGTAPNKVAPTSNLKYFKVDWSFKNCSVKSNIAIPAQPIRELFCTKKIFLNNNLSQM